MLHCAEWQLGYTTISLEIFHATTCIVTVLYCYDVRYNSYNNWYLLQGHRITVKAVLPILAFFGHETRNET